VKADKFIALDIGTDGIRMAVVSRTGSELPELLDTGEVLFDAEPASEMAREAVVAMALKRLLDERKPKVNKAVLSIEGQSVFFRLVKLPMVDVGKRGQMVRHEAVQNIPFPIDEVVWDAHIIDPDSAEPEVLLIAVKADVVNGLVHAVRATGLTIERIEVAPVALANLLKANSPENKASMLLVDGGMQSTNLVFMNGPRMFFRTLPVAGSNHARLSREIERSISFFVSQHGGLPPELVLTSGLTAGLQVPPGEAETATKLINPLNGFKNSSGGADENQFAVAAGLAAERSIAINLIPDVLVRERRLRRRAPALMAGALLLLLVGMIWVFGLNKITQLTRLESEQVNACIAELEDIEEQLIPLESRMAGLNREAAVYMDALRKRRFWLETFGEIRRLLPEGMFLISSEPLDRSDPFKGVRISVVSYLDKESADVDAVKMLRDKLRESDRFSEETKVFSRPSKIQFARQFVLDVYTEGGVR